MYDPDGYVPGDEILGCFYYFVCFSLIVGLPICGIVNHFSSNNNDSIEDDLNEMITQVIDSEQTKYCIEFLDNNICVHEVNAVNNVHYQNEDYYIADIGNDDYEMFSTTNTIVAHSLKEVNEIVCKYEDKDYSIDWIQLSKGNTKHI